jgi:hypothetical protein
MNERAVRWIHQADDSVVHGARQIGPEMRDFEVVTESGKARHFRQTRLLGGRCRAAFWIRHKSPDVSVALRTGEAACVDSLTFQFRICCKRRDHKALAGVRFKLPAMVGAFDGFTVKLPEGKGKRTVRANVAEGEGFADNIATENKRDIEQHCAHEFAPRNLFAA